MKKSLLVTIFALSLPISSYALTLTCPSLEVLNKQVHSGNVEEPFSTSGFNSSWQIENLSPMRKTDNFTSFTAIYLPYHGANLKCLYHATSENKPKFNVLVDNDDMGPFQGIGNKDKWYGTDNHECAGGTIEECSFERK